MRIAVYNEKGGSGKTTVAVAVAVSMSLPMLDLDPQGTATHWLSQRTPALSKAKKTDPAWVADCQPGISPAIVPTLASAGLILIPVRASFPDLVTLPDTIKFLRANTKAKLGFVASDIDRRTNDEAMLKETLKPHDIQMFGVFAHRASYRRAGIAGMLASEIDSAAKVELELLITNIKGLT